MADNKTKQKTAVDEEQSNDSPVADLNVSTIIVALHQNAVAKCQGDLADKYRIVNSAIDESTGTATLTSSGEQIVSVIPTEAAASSKAFDELGTMPKEDAVKILKTYVQWFVGPDLAKKVSNKTVIALTDAPKDMKDVQARKDAKAIEDEKKEQSSKSAEDKQKEKEEGEHREAQQNAEKDLVDTESVMPVIKFSQFLREADEKTEASSEKPEKEAKSKDAKAKLQQVDPMEVDATTKPQAGYYIVYEMKVEGLKEVKLEDSKKSMRKSIMNYLGNFFDDVKITASGLFGGGDSFTVKDVKDKLRQTFGPIDPDELVRNVQERLDKKFKGSSPRAEVEVQDKRTLIADLGSYIDGTQKRQIEKADYSLTISIDQDDPKKDILNRGLVADIVQASIKGLWKKFRNRISKNDVIYIPNYQNIHKDTEKVRALYQKVPSPNRIKAQIQKASDVNIAVNNIDKMFSIIGGSKYKDECPRAEKCDAAWKSFREKNKTGDRADELAKIHRGSPAFDDYFKKFLDQYTKVYNDTEMADLSESLSRKVCFMVSNAEISKMLVESMFGSTSLWEEDNESNAEDNVVQSADDTSKEDNKNKKQAFDSSKAKKHARHYLKDVVNDAKVVCGSIDEMNKHLEFFNDEVKDDEFKNAIVVLPSSSDSMSELSESQISDDIFSLLFEEDPAIEDASEASDEDAGEATDNTSNNGKKMKSDDNANASNSNGLDEKIHKILAESLKVANAEDIGNFFVLKPKTLNEAENDAVDAFKAKQSESLSRAVTSYLTSKKAGGGRRNNDFYIGISSSDAAVKFLKEHGLGTDADYERLLKRQYAFMFLTYPKPAKPLPMKNGKGTKSAGGTPGYEVFNANEVKSIVDGSGICANDVNVFTITGKPSKADVSSQVFHNNKSIAYTGTDVIPECKIYLASVDLKEDGTSSSNTKADIPSIKNAYALTFDKEEIIEVKPEEIDIKAGDTRERHRNDLYIVPMPGLQYEDPEYANKKLM